MCETPDGDETDHGVRIFRGRWSDAYLGRFPIRPGYAYVIWRGRHVAEPTDLTPEEAAGYWSEVAHVARALEQRYEPAKMNWSSLGNGVPHLHVHLVPRPFDDPMAGGPIEDDAFETANDRPLPEDVIAAEVDALRRLLTQE
jgi:diadenosine tetraphosphate (Ap4A) HIT family hydrolase